jgi:hypothetical protein
MRADLLTTSEIIELTEECEVWKDSIKLVKNFLEKNKKYITSSPILPMLSFLRGSIRINEKDSVFKAFLKKDLLESITFYEEWNK